MALVLVDYDLYVLRDHENCGRKWSSVCDQFYAARYELFGAATFIRAGFELRGRGLNLETSFWRR
jgi:hypothetical protein